MSAEAKDPGPPEKVAVVGAGTMGSGIAHVFLDAGSDVVLIDSDPEALEEAAAALDARVLRRKKGERPVLRTSGDLAAAEGCGLAVEAVFEDLVLKKEIISKLADILPEDALIATNTSSLSVAQLAESCRDPERFLGLHFMNPAPVMKLVEVVRAEATSDETVRRACGIVRALGKTPVVAADRPGFVVNRLLIPMINEAALLVEEGVADAESVDSAMKLGANLPMGPLHLGDLIGLDVVLATMKQLDSRLGEKYRPSALLVELVESGKLGRKTGEGFFKYGPRAGGRGRK